MVHKKSIRLSPYLSLSTQTPKYQSEVLQLHQKMAAFDALVSLAQTTDLNRYDCQGRLLFPMKVAEKIRSIHACAVCLQSSLENENFPDKGSHWEGRIRDLAHEAENSIENFLSLRIYPDLENQLKNVMEKISLIVGEVMEERPAYLPPSSSSSSSRIAAATANNTVIGLEDDVTKIRDRLYGEPSSNLQVIPIVGMAGIGKTTLATTLYNHASISQHFDFRAWITVSQDYNSMHSLRKILLGLLESMNILEELVSGQKIDGSEVDEEGHEDFNEKLEKVDVSEMETKVFQNLKYRRYLIVMDDVWSTEVWDDLMNIFPDDGNGSRIMVTTRLLEVAAYPDSNSPLHEMQIMNDAQSWNLLKQKVFANGDCPSHLKDVGEEIGKSCAGLPLTVVLVAGLLSMVNSTRASWEEIAKNVNSVVGKEVDGILSLSYTHLPHYLRPCFLYFGGFPEDEKIRAATLVKLWVAEGFVKDDNERDKSLEEEAEEYLEDFVQRNLVIVNSRKIDGKIKSCSLHDMVRDLCIRKGYEEKFLYVMDGRVIDSRERIDEQRRISWMLSNMDSCLWRAPTTRTILIFDPVMNSSSSDLQNVLGRFKLLRVFHGARDMSPQVFQLFNLRYLALSASLKITSAISNLVNLQTLIIHHDQQKKITWRYNQRFARDFSLPMEIWRLPQLRHFVLHYLYIVWSLPHPPYGSIPLTNLQTLSLIRNLVWSEKMVQMIPNVKAMGLVYSRSHQGFRLHHLKDLLQLEKLQIIMCGDFSWVLENPNFPTSLKKLTLMGGGFPWVDMSIIGSLPNLQVLKLRDYVCIGEVWETGDEEFPGLKYLLIETSFLRQWIMQSGSFSILERLVLRYCWDLEKIPEEIGEIPTLELIEVRECRESVGESAKQIKEYQQSCRNDDLQLHCVDSRKTRPSRFAEQREEQGEQPSIEVEGVGIRYIDELQTEEALDAEVKVEKVHGILKKMRVKCNRVGKFFLSPCRKN